MVDPINILTGLLLVGFIGGIMSLIIEAMEKKIDEKLNPQTVDSLQ